jgi:hypothetical protein
MKAVSALLLPSLCLVLSARCLALETRPAQTTQSTRPATATLTLAVVVEDKQKQIQATIKADGKPVENADVMFYATRTFGNLLLGKDRTLDDGTADVLFPSGLPPGPSGKIQVIARVVAPEKYSSASAELTIESDAPSPPPEPFPRALWAPQAPALLIVAILGIMAAVWLTYAYVACQLLAISRER